MNPFHDTSPPLEDAQTLSPQKHHKPSSLPTSNEALQEGVTGPSTKAQSADGIDSARGAVDLPDVAPAKNAEGLPRDKEDPIEQTQASQTWMQGFETTMESAGINSEQAQTVLSWLHNTSRQGLEDDSVMATQLSQQMQAHMQAEWGLNYDRNLALARRGLRNVSAKTGDATALETILQQAGLADDPSILKIFYALGEEHADAPIIGLGHGERLGISSASQAKKRIAALHASTHANQALYNQRDPHHEEAVKQLRQLYETAYQPRPSS